MRWSSRFCVDIALLTSLRGCLSLVCDAGSTFVRDDQVNDDFCDCTIDGADEFLTPACSHAALSSVSFSCIGSGPLNQTVSMSRVWDGVCDCCDGSDEVGNQGGGSMAEPQCSLDGCGKAIHEAREEAISHYNRVKEALAKRSEVVLQAEEAVRRWSNTLSDADANDKRDKKTRKELEQLEIKLKVYLQDEERAERQERIELARDSACSSSRRWGRAAALGTCDDRSEERRGATQVRARRLSARTRHDEEENRKRDRRETKKKKQRKRRGERTGDTGGHQGLHGLRTTPEDILALTWATTFIDDTSEAATGDNNGGSDSTDQNEDREASVARRDAISLRSYVAQRQGGSRATGTLIGEAERAEELRRTTLLGPVLNDGHRGLLLGLTVLLRMMGLPTLGLLRGMLVVFSTVTHALLDQLVWLIRRAGTFPSLVGMWERYVVEGLPGVSQHLDYRRYPVIRSLTMRWNSFIEGSGRFLLVMWDAPLAVWDYVFPTLDYDHQRPEAALLREGLEMTRAVLQESNGNSDARKHGGRGPSKALSEAKRLQELDLGEKNVFAAIAEACFDLQQGEYLYKLCPFKEAKQGRHSLGRWAGWGPERDGEVRSTMRFESGARCQKYDIKRSAEAFLACGPDHALVRATEVEICRYHLTLETPLACTQESLREAEITMDRFAFWDDEGNGTLDDGGPMRRGDGEHTDDIIIDNSDHRGIEL